ncbi:glycosyltransferase [bacterium]|nr:glycosyltransferase [bacterium]
MNILFLSPEIPFPPDGGHHLRTLNILKILAQKHEIYLIAFAQNRSEFEYVAEMEKYCKQVHLFPVAKTGFNVQFILLALRNLFSRTPVIAQRYFLKSACQKIKEIQQSRSIDLVHIDMLALGLYQSCFSESPVLLTDHNVESLRLYRWMKVHRNLPFKAYLWCQYQKMRLFEKHICSTVTHCTVVSHHDLILLGNLCEKGHFSVIPNGVDTEYFYPMEAPSVPLKMVWVGGMRSPYNADAVDYFLTTIWPIIREEVPTASIDFIGAAPTDRLQKCAAQDRRLNVLGFLPDIRPLVQQAGVFIAPIRSGSGTKLKVLNAMAQAKAVVATACAAEGIEAQDGKHLFIAQDHRHFADLVIRLLRHPQIAEQVGRDARRLIEETYSWQVIARDLDVLYESFRQRRIPIDPVVKNSADPATAVFRRRHAGHSPLENSIHP